MDSKKHFINTEIFLAIILTFAGIALLFFGQLTDPVGEISTSVLVAFGELMTFVGALLGINYKYKELIQKIINDKKKEDDCR